MVLVVRLLVLVLLIILFQKVLLHPLQRLISLHDSNLNFTNIHPVLFFCQLTVNLPTTTKQKEKKPNVSKGKKVTC